MLPEFNQQLERRMPVTSDEPVAKKAKSDRRPSGHFEDCEHTAYKDFRKEETVSPAGFSVEAGGRL